MGFYDKYILPSTINALCGMKAIGKQREKVVPMAEGRVLEIGMGTGLNLPYYDAGKVDKLWGLEPAMEMWAKAEPAVAKLPFEFEFIGLKGEEIPLEDNSVDTVVLTYTLCTIPDFNLALEQMRRVLKPEGKMVFTEHGKAPDAAIQKWQNRINPFWNKFAGGCNLNREIAKLIDGAGFDITNLDQGYIPGPKIATYNYWGIAKTR